MLGFPCSLGAESRVLGTRRRSRGFQPSVRSKLDHVDIMKSSTSSMNRTMVSRDGFLKIDVFTVTDLMLLSAFPVNSRTGLCTICCPDSNWSIAAGDRFEIGNTRDRPTHALYPASSKCRRVSSCNSSIERSSTMQRCRTHAARHLVSVSGQVDSHRSQA